MFNEVVMAATALACTPALLKVIELFRNCPDCGAHRVTRSFWVKGVFIRDDRCTRCPRRDILTEC